MPRDDTPFESMEVYDQPDEAFQIWLHLIKGKKFPGKCIALPTRTIDFRKYME